MSTWMMGVAESSSPQDRRAAWERGALLISTSSTSATDSSADGPEESARAPLRLPWGCDT